ncbi:hypothetical protein [Candidatus Burkholderia verschuerenii]|uniref:hypothetical protein n=1 Tax=Candidatus Burkholderia verschuerenii TaxID=242163 RepID=UPI00067B9653|nr:hypothetical protein [Candidatus Burkholderia verschuerenii]
MNKISKASMLGGALLIARLGMSGAAMAGVSVGVNIGVPAPVYVAPAPVYAPPPPPVYAAPAIVIDWHGDRYWDGRRYWDRDDYYRHHGGGYYGNDHGRHNGWH